jgi:hypothetical protein
MSVQLILYPQNYEGQYSTISTPFFTEYVSDYSFNIGALGSGFSGTANTQDHMYSKLSPLNIWQQYNATGGAYTTANAATVSSGKITLDSASSGYSLTGIYQLISNLTIGSTYVLKVQRLAGTTGFSTIGHTNSWSNSGILYHPITFTALPNTLGTHTFTFTATHTEQVFSINYANNDNSNLEIGEVSIKESVGSAPTTDVFKDGQVICDLYEESNIPLSLSVDDFKNVHEKKQSFSKPFRLPATKRNNKIFSSLFDVTKSVKNDVFSFNPYKKTKAILKEDGYTIFDGYLTLIDVVDKQNEISYNVNLFGETITLADKLKDKKFKHIDFTELSHNYNKSNIKASFESNDGVSLVNSLTTDSFAYNATLGVDKTDVIKYPFIKWNGDSYLDAGNVKLQTLEDAFRPFINCKYLLDRIITEAGFTYSSDFLNSTDFTKLFMDFNFGDSTPNLNTGSSHTQLDAPTGGSTIYAGTSYTTLIPLITGTFGSTPAIAQYNTATGVYTADVNNFQFNIGYSIDIQNTDASSRDVTFALVTSTGIEYDLQTHTVAAGTTHNFTGYTTGVILNSGETIRPAFKATAGSVVKFTDYFGSTVVSQTNLVSTGILTVLRGDLGQFDFLKGLFTMFNLLVLQDKDNPSNLIIEPYQSVFIDAASQYITHKTLDWTSKVDISEIKLKPLKLKKKVFLDFVEDSNDYPLGIYKNATGYKYGSEEIDASIFTGLDGETKVEAKPFSPTFVKPIFDGFTTEMTIPVIYKGNEDGTFESYDNKPRILFNIGKVTMSNNTYYIPAQNGGASENQSSFLQFSHLTETPTTVTTKDYNFRTGQLIGSIGNTPIDNLYNTYWSPYYDELYNPDTRLVNIKIYLTPSDIANFEFYYKIRIKNREYRVNKIEYKPYELSSVELILIP